MSEAGRAEGLWGLTFLGRRSTLSLGARQSPAPLRTERNGVFPLLALLLFLNGGICLCDGHDAAGHHHSVLQESTRAQGGSQQTHPERVPDEDHCLRMDVIGIGQLGAGPSALQGPFLVAPAVAEPVFGFATGLDGGAEPPRIDPPPRLHALCTLLC